MAVTNAAQAATKTVADPNAAYESVQDIWRRCRAVCSGERYVKDHDRLLDLINFKNLLIPFSTTMTQSQYDFYRMEAELPGVSAQFARTLKGGLLRKKPVLKIPDSLPEGTMDWIMNQFGADDSPLTSFIDDALWEELQTNRAWVFIDHPKVDNGEKLTSRELSKFKPYPIIYQGEAIINWRVSVVNGKQVLSMVAVRGQTETFEENEFHPTYRQTVWVHELDDQGLYRIRVYKAKSADTNVPVIAGAPVQKVDKVVFELDETIDNILANGKRLDYIPAWPLNGCIEITEPILLSFIDKEISLYNKISRRNHLLYGAATYTPIIYSDMSDEDFQSIVDSGLGTWIHLRRDDRADVLRTPTEALSDMEAAIASGFEEMAKIGVRMLAPEVSQSGVALELRNAAQTSQVGSLSTKVSNTMCQIIAAMINWRYGTTILPQDIDFKLSEDFNVIPLDANGLRLVTEWYDMKLIPRSAWLRILKKNEILEPDYDDEKAKEEIDNDEFLENKENELLPPEDVVIPQEDVETPPKK